MEIFKKFKGNLRKIDINFPSKRNRLYSTQKKVLGLIILL